MTFQELASKKVLGVPVLYVAGAAVTILAIVAWKMKATPDADTMGTNPEDGTAGADGESKAGGIAGMDDPYGDYNTNGTVVVQPVAPVTPDPVVPDAPTNDTWLRAAVDYLVDSKQATPGEAQAAITKYLDGEDLSYNEGLLRDAAIGKLKLPPENIGKLGITGSAPAQKQFSAFPGKHTVKGANDNTPGKLADLYYGNSDTLHVNRIVASNENLGPASTTYSVGTAVTIPVYTIVNYYKVRGVLIKGLSDQYFTTLSKQFGISSGQILALNPGLSQPIPVGTNVRTQ